MKIIIGGDLVPTKSNIEFFESGNIESIIDNRIIDILKNADYRIFNLEVPLFDLETPIIKAGPNLKAPTKSIKGIKKMKVDFVTLANNHILDYGEAGLESTINILNNNKISYSGVGDIKTAGKPYFVQKENKKIGIFCCTEHEFSVVTNDNKGANPFDALQTPDLIFDIKKQCDYLIVLYHGGKEHFRYPSPNLQKICHKLVDKGADLIICQHSHCIGCKEEYNNSTIVYGQGNFIFDYKDNEFWNNSLLIELELKDDNKVKINYIPIQKNGNGIQYADKECEKILQEFEDRSEIIKNHLALSDIYEKFSNSNLDYYLLPIASRFYNNILFRVINKLSGKKLQKIVVKRCIKKKAKFLINIIECEAHNELIITALKNKIKNKYL